MPAAQTQRASATRMAAAAPFHTGEMLEALERQIERDLNRKLRAVALATGQSFERNSDPIDLANELASRQSAAAQMQRDTSNIAELTAALRRLRESPATFGRCHSCNGLIPGERLEILPTARTCVYCH